MAEHLAPPDSGGSIPTPPLHFTVTTLRHTDAKLFIETWHYSHKLPTGKNIFFGCWLNGALYAAANYGIGVNPYQAKFLQAHTGAILSNNTLIELKRLCRSDPKQNLPLTKFLSICHRLLRKMGYKAVLSFSDPAFKHSGGLYKAANFKWIGKTNCEWHLVDKDGTPRHRRYAFRYARRMNIPLAQAREVLGVTRIKTLPKDRWLLLLPGKAA